MGVRVLDKSSQKEVELSPKAAQEAIRRGDATLPAGRVTIRRGQETATLDPAEFGKAFDQGWDLSDAEEAHSLRIKREETDAASGALGMLEAGASGLTLGTSRMAAEALGADPERMRARAEGLGAMEDVIEIGASVAPALLTGGGSLAATAGATAAKVGAKQALKAGAKQALRYSPAGLATRAGAAVERAGVKALGGAGASGLGGVVRRGVPIAGRGMVEGFAFGAGAEIDEAILGDREINTDYILASGAMGGALGGAGEVLMRQTLPAMMSGARRVSTSAARKVLGNLTGAKQGSAAVAENLAQRTVGKAGDFMEATGITAGPEFSRTGKRIFGGEAGKVQTGIARFKHELDGFKTRVRTKFEELGTVNRELDDLSFGARYDAPMPRNADEIAPRVSSTYLEGIERKLDDALDLNARRGGKQFYGPDVEDLRDLTIRTRAMMEADGTAKGAHKALDDFKRSADQVLKKRRKRLATTSDPEVENTVDLIGDILGRRTEDLQTGGVRQFLESETLFGKVGADQAARNASYSGRKGLRDKARGSGNKFNQSLFDPTIDASDAEVAKFVRQWGSDATASTEQQARAMFDAELDHITMMRKTVDLSAVDEAKLLHKEKVIKDIVGEMEKKADIATIADDYWAVRGDEGGGSASITVASTLGPTIGGALGAALGGPVGLAAGAFLGGITRPATMLRSMAAIMSVAEKVKGRSDGAVRRFLKGAGAKALPALEGGATAAGKAAARYPVTKTAEGRTTDETKRERFDRVRSALAHASANPGAVTKRLEGQLAVLDEVAPKLAGLVNERANQAAQYLLGKMPPVYTPPFAGPQQALVDPMAMERFMRRVSVAEDPIVALDALADGNITKEHSETLRDLYPAMFGDVQDSITEALGEAQATNKPWPMGQRVAVGVLFGVETDPSLAPQSQAMIQMAHAPSPGQEQAAGAGKPKRAKTTGGEMGQAKPSGTARMETPMAERYS